MNRKLQFIFSLLPLVAAFSAAAQAPSTGPVSSIVEASRISRIFAGPGDRPQGFLLRNGIFVALSPGLAQQLPPAIAKNASIRAAGDELSYNGNKTIEARSITIAGVSYEDQGPAAGPAPTPLRAALPPGPPSPARLDGVGPRGTVPLPPPPEPCGPGAPPSPPPAIAGPNAPVPPPPGDITPVPPNSPDGAPAPPAPKSQQAPPPQN